MAIVFHIAKITEISLTTKDILGKYFYAWMIYGVFYKFPQNISNNKC